MSNKRRAGGETAPSAMRAVRLYEYGGPEVLQIEEVPVPEPGPNEVLMRVRAIAVNGWDTMFRGGHTPQVPGRPAPRLPFQLGREAAGEIAAVGAEVTDRRVGDRVVMMANPSCGTCHYCAKRASNLCVKRELPGHTLFGSYAEYVVLAADAVIPAPEDIPFEELAPLVWSFGTALHMINLVKVEIGDVVIATAASSSVGVACVQLAKLAGAGAVIALTRSPADKGAVLREHGARAVLDPRAADTPGIIREMCPGFGVDVYLDNYGDADSLQFGMDIADLGGRIVLVATAADREDNYRVPFSLGQAFGKHLTIFGARASTRWEQLEVVRLAAERRIRMPIAEVLPLSEIRRAHELQEAHGHVGKIVVTL